jgi:hypothetical protein
VAFKDYFYRIENRKEFKPVLDAKALACLATIEKVDGVVYIGVRRNSAVREWVWRVNLLWFMELRLATEPIDRPTARTIFLRYTHKDSLVEDYFGFTFRVSLWIGSWSLDYGPTLYYSVRCM